MTELAVNAQDWERSWWGDCSNSFGEEAKQITYAHRMGLVNEPQAGKLAVYDLGGKSVVDLGGGPVSLLLKCVNRGDCVVVDPCPYPLWVRQRYTESGIGVAEMEAEAFRDSAFRDEAWCYNVLQHVVLPEDVIATARSQAQVLRIFEWLETPAADGHPHTLHADELNEWIGGVGQVGYVNENGAVGLAYWGVFDVYDTLHVVALPHTQTNGEYATCAYTEKVRKFCDMMTGRGRQVILYSGEYNTAACDEHVCLVTETQRQAWFGEHDLGSLERGGFDWEPSSPWWSEMNARAVGEIALRKDDTDLLCLSSGRAQQVIADSLGQMIVAEFGVGYEGIIVHRHGLSPAFAAFESHAHRHLVYGLNRWQNSVREYDTVIPNFFDPDELPLGHGGDYLLFVGRLIQKKGVSTAAQVAEALGMELIVAGPGATEWGDGYVRFPEGEAHAPGLEYVGAVGVEERARLMGGAAVTLVPTTYSEPFGGVAVESMMCGTPVVTTDFGAFTETVSEGVSGYRFQTLQEAVDATDAARDLDREYVRQYALGKYSLDAVAPMYDRWFGNLDELWGEGWTALRDREAVV